MSTVARTCLRTLLIYALIAAAVGAVVYHRFPELGAAIWSGIIAGFFVWLAFAYLLAIPSHLLDWWRMRPGVPPRDGKRSAVIGPIRASGHSLHAPFSKTPCVAYHYKITSMETESESTDYEGFALVPSYIATDEGQVRVHAYPELDVPWNRLTGEEPRDHARAWIAATTFKNTRAEGLEGMMAELRQLNADDDGSIRYDYRIDPVADDLGKCRIEERVIRSGETVCALGKYSEQRKALVPDPAVAMHPVTITLGERGSFRGKALRKAFGSAVGVVICAALVAGAALLFLMNVPMDAAEQRNPARRFLWEEVKLERWLERQVRQPLQAADVVNAPGMHFLTLCNGCATGRFEANGRVLELKHAGGWQNDAQRVIHLAAAAGERDGVTITAARQRDAIPEVILTLNGRSFPVPREWLAARDYETALDANDLLDGRLTVMAPNDAVRVRASFRVPLENR